MFFIAQRRRIARSIVAVIAAGFIQVGFSVPVANAAPLAAPTITSSTVTATTITVNLQTSGFAATSWRYIVNRRQVSGCATSVTDGAVQTTASLQSSITITGLTEGCYYTVKVAGFNGSIGTYAAVEKLVNGYFNGLKGYHKNENTTYEGFTRVPFTSGTCSNESITLLNKSWGTGSPSGCNIDHFTSYFVGYVKAPYTGTVTFRSSNDDGLQLNIQGQNVLFNGTTGTSGSINMLADEIYRIEIWFHEYGGGANFSLDWEYTGQARIQIPTANLASDPSLFFGTCPLGLDPRCAAGSALEIKRATGTNMDGQYWINVNGTPTLVFCVMNSSQGGGGWMLAMRGKNASSTFKYDSALWTNSTLLNESYPERFRASDTIDTYRNTDAKYAPFSNLPGNQVMVLYPEVDNKAGGAFGTNGSANATGVNSVKYGFAWHETVTTGTAWTTYNSTTKWGGNSAGVAHTNGPTATPACVTTPKTLSNLFNEASRCAFRRVSSNYVSTESPYSAVGDNVFFSQTNIRFFGINYGNANTSFFSKARIGFGWNENGPGNEDSNDGNGGIGLSSSGSTSLAAGTFNGCCSATVNAADANTAGQTGLSGGDGTTRQLGFELYVRNSVEISVSGRSVLKITQGRTASYVAGNGYSASNNTGATTFRLSSIRDGFTIDPSNGVITASEALPLGTYTTVVTAGDANSASGSRTVTIQVVADSGDVDQSITFNGTNQYLKTTGTVGLWSNFTYEAWIRPRDNCSDSNVFRRPLSTTNVHISCGNGNWYVGITDNSSTFTRTQIAQRVFADEWVHIAVVRSGTTVTVYYNNVQTKVLVGASWVDNLTVSTIKNDFSQISVGGTGTANEYFNGQVDEVKIWNSARTLQEIWTGAHQAENLGSSSLLMYWDFNETTAPLASRSQPSDSNFDFTEYSSPFRSFIASISSSGPYNYVTVPRTIITKNGGFQMFESVTAVSVLVLGGGGGGGGGYQGGGGGAGGFVERTLNVSELDIYPVKVGVGGVGAANPLAPSSGDTSTAFGVSAAGGGRGTSEFASPYVRHSNEAGGSGGGGSWAEFMTGASGIAGQGFAGGTAANLDTCSPIQRAGSGGGGATSAGFAPTCLKGGDGGSGLNTSISNYYSGILGTGALAAGGGGSLRSATATSHRGLGGSTAAGNSAYTSNAAVGATGGATNAKPTSGSGGGAGMAADGVNGNGGSGGSGVVIFRYIVAKKPTFTQPTNAFLNVGMTETFSVNVAQDSQTAQLTRTFRWESSTSGSGGPFTLIKQGTGAANASFSWVPTDTSTTGSNFLYRVIVTDSDTAGLFIVDTSTAVFATINQALQLTSKSTLTKTVGVSKTETFTVSLGTPTYRYSLSPDGPNFWLDTSTVGSPRIRFADTATVGTYYETFTVTDSVSASISVPLTIIVSPPPSFSANAAQVDSGTVLYLDAGNTSSYSGSGNTWSDISGRGLTANMTQTFTGTQIAANGSTRTGATMTSNCAAPTYSTEVLGSINFNGSSQCAYVANNGVQTSYTVEMWIKRNGAQTGWASTILTTPYRFGSDPINISVFWLDGTTLTAGVYQSSGNWKTATGFVVDDATWTHISVTLDGPTLRLIKNGDFASAQSVPTGYTTWNLSTMDSGLLIGQRWGEAASTSGWYKGSLAALRIYSRPLSDAEISQNYNATKGRFLKTQNKQLQTGKYGTTINDTYTVTAGSETITAVFTQSAVTGLRWDTSTVRSMSVQLQESLTAGTYNDTITVTDIYGSSTRISLTIIVAKADTITVTMDTPTVTTFNDAPITVFPRPIIKGLVNSDTATVTTKFESASYALSATAPKNSDTYTVTATDLTMLVGSLNNYLGVVVETSTARINKARQNPLMVSTYTAIVGSSFAITVLGGSGDGAISETLTGVSTAPNCQVSNRILTSSATTTSYCQLRITKAESQNYFSESTTALFYFIEFVFTQAAPSVGSGPNVALTGENDVTLDVDLAPIITSLSTYSATPGVTTLLINGAGFDGSDPRFELKFWRGIAGTGYTIDPAKTQISVIVPAGARTGKVIVVTSKGIATSEFSLVVTP